jgi:DNA-directed RNA polymerase specialized sigma24 family protein
MDAPNHVTVEAGLSIGPARAGATRAASNSTPWSVIKLAQGNGPAARAALGELIARYEATVLSTIRRCPYPPNCTPLDLKQEFFRGVIERDDVRKLNREKGSFRGWLCKAVRNFVRNRWRQYGAVSAGHGVTGPLLENGISSELDADRLYEKAFAENTLAHVLERHRSEHAPGVFEVLVRFLPGPDVDLENTASGAKALRMTKNAFGVAVYRARKRHRELLYEAVAEILDLNPSDPAARPEIEREMRLLYRALSECPDPTLRGGAR